jgi:hypothetical protein
MEGRPYILMRTNLWFDGDPTQPSLDDLKRLLMWIAEEMAKSVQVRIICVIGEVRVNVVLCSLIC